MDRSQYSTRFELFKRKRDELPALDLGLPGMIGHLIEPTAKYLFEVMSEEKLGHRETINRYPLGLYRSRTYPWMLASPDADTVSGKLCQLKATAPEVIRSWAREDRLPDDWFLQEQQEMEVMECDEAFVGVFVTTNDFRIFRVQRDDRIIKLLANAQKDLWERIQSNNPPEPNWSHATTYDIVKKLHVDATEGKVVELDEAALELRDKEVELGQRIKALEAERDACKARLAYLAADAQKVIFPDGSGMSRISVASTVVPAYERKGYFYFRNFGGKKKKAS